MTYIHRKPLLSYSLHHPQRQLGGSYDYSRGVRAKRQQGELTVTAEEVDNDANEIVQFVCKGMSLDKKDFFGKSDPFLQLYKVNDDGRLVYKF